MSYKAFLNKIWILEEVWTHFKYILNLAGPNNYKSTQKLIQRIGILIHYLLKIWNLSLFSIHWIVNRYSLSLRAEKIFFGFRFLYSVSLKGCVKLVAARCGNHTTSAEYRAVDVVAIWKCEFWPDYLGNPEIKYGAKVLTKVSDSRKSCISSVTISASANNFLSWQSYKKIFNAVMFDECVLALWPEMATRGRLFNLISAFLHILSVVLQ